MLHLLILSLCYVAESLFMQHQKELELSLLKEKIEKDKVELSISFFF